MNTRSKCEVPSVEEVYIYKDDSPKLLRLSSCKGKVRSSDSTGLHVKISE